MKTCPKCKEEYPEFADTCPECYIDLDTGETIEIDKDIDLEQLRQAFKSLVFNYKICLWSMGLFIMAIIVAGMSQYGRIIYFVSEKSAIISLLVCFVMLFKFSSSINNVRRIIKEDHLAEKCLTWISPFFVGYNVYHRAKEILKKVQSKGTV